MKSRIRTQKKRTREQIPDTTAQAKPMFQSRPFVVQSQSAQKSQPPDLKTSLKQAERYGHHVSQMQLTGVSAREAVQPKKTDASSKAECIQRAKTGGNKDDEREKPADSSKPGAQRNTSGQEESDSNAITEAPRTPERGEQGGNEQLQEGMSKLNIGDAKEDTQPKPNRKPVNYFSSNSLRFARHKRRKQGVVDKNFRSGRNYATGKIDFTNAEGERVKTRHLTKRSDEVPKNADYKAGHSEKHVLTRLNQIKKDQESRQTGNTVRLREMASELEDCGKDVNNCNARMADHEDKPKIRYGIPYPDTRDYPMGKEDKEGTPEQRKKWRKNAVKKLKKAGTRLRNEPEKEKHQTKIDSEYSDLEYDSASTGTDTEYETDVETADWKEQREKKRGGKNVLKNILSPRKQRQDSAAEPSSAQVEGKGKEKMEEAEPRISESSESTESNEGKSEGRRESAEEQRMMDTAMEQSTQTLRKRPLNKEAGEGSSKQSEKKRRKKR